MTRSDGCARDGFPDALADHAAEAASGAGRLVVVAGEAGIGKTTLVLLVTLRDDEPDDGPLSDVTGRPATRGSTPGMNLPQLGLHVWELHARIWRPNPAGTFADYHTRVGSWPR